jgi:hypothetical protein
MLVDPGSDGNDVDRGFNAVGSTAPSISCGAGLPDKVSLDGTAVQSNLFLSPDRAAVRPKRRFTGE